MDLYPGEVACTRWALTQISDIAEGIRVGAKHAVTVIAVDGRSGGGKTTFAKALANELNAALLSTDDFAWWHSFFDWSEMIVANAITPLVSGQSIEYRPEAWIERGREGAICALASPFVIIEGVGSLQKAIRENVNVGIWLQSDAKEAKRRGLERDLDQRPDPLEAERFWNEWQKAEDEFQTTQQSWKCADLWVCGTPKLLGLENTRESFLSASQNRETVG